MSTFAWIDPSEKQRRQILEAIDLFREKDTRDELGLAGIRDAFSDMLFPGTGSQQTRARYFFFVPWMYLDFEAKRVPSSEVARKGRELELKLIDRLAASSHPPPPGTIGIHSRQDLQRIPSNIYWNGLRNLGICLHPGSQAQYHRTQDRRIAAAGAVRKNADGELVGDRAQAWHASLPQAPSSFPGKPTFQLTVPEAQYLKGRVLENHRASLFAFLLDRDYEDVDVPFVWEHPLVQSVPGSLDRELEHARCFSEAMHGAAILYNLYLAELDPRKDKVIAECEPMFDDWLTLVTQRSEKLREWRQKRVDFWNLLLSRGCTVSVAAQAFVDTWCDRITGEPRRLREDPHTRALIFEREKQVKGLMARCESREMRWRWNGGSGLGQYGFRWGIVRGFLQDISAGLAASHA